MPTKAEIEEEINSTLDMDMEWSKMTKDDLLRIQEMVENGDLAEKLVKKMVKEKGTDKAEDIIESWYPGKYLI